jgi:hypothetical protein
MVISVTMERAVVASRRRNDEKANLYSTSLGAVGVEGGQIVLAATQTAILPLVPYLDTLPWLFIVVAHGGIAVTIYARIDDWRRGRRRLPSSSAGSRPARGCGRRCITTPSRWQCSCSCFRFGVPASERDASLNVSKTCRKPMIFNAGCWMRRLAVLPTATSLLTGCATVASERRLATRPPSRHQVQP